MSGGHFDKRAYRLMEEMAVQLEICIDNNETPNAYGYFPGFTKETLSTLHYIQHVMLVAAELAKEADLLYSGDIGELTFKDQVRPALKEMKELPWISTKLST